MDLNAHIWSIIVCFVLVMMSAILWFWTSGALSSNLTTNNLQEANKMAVYYSVDKASRGQRGVLYINPKKYEYIISHTHIRQFGGHEVPDSNYQISYIPDKKARLSTDDTDPKGTGYIPVRGIEIATYYSQHARRNHRPSRSQMESIHTNDVRHDPDLYSSDYLVNADGRVSSNDADNDITRPHDTSYDGY